MASEYQQRRYWHSAAVTGSGHCHLGRKAPQMAYLLFLSAFAKVTLLNRYRSSFSDSRERQQRYRN